MSDYTELDELDGLADVLEDFELDEDIDADDADFLERRRRRARARYRRPPRTAPGRGLYQPRPSSNYVTQTQLQTALAKVGQQINTNSEANMARKSSGAVSRRRVIFAAISITGVFSAL